MAVVYGIDGLREYLRRKGRSAGPVIKSALARTAVAYVTKLRDGRMSGPTSGSTLSSRSGALRRGIRFKGVTTEANGYVARVTSNKKYVVTHFGPKGSETVIRPKNAKALTIPLAAALTSAGVAKGTARNGPWGKTVIIPTKRQGNTTAIIYGVRQKQSGKKKGMGYGGLVPLFALVKSVRIPARIDPKDFLGFLTTEYLKNLSEGMEKTNA